MKVLVIDNFETGGLLDLVLRAQNAGHKVKWFAKRSERQQHFGQGMADIVDDWREWMRWADLVILADNTHYLRETDPWRKEVPIVGATQESAKWEIDRKTGMSVFKKAGIAIPEYKEFTDCAAAVKHVEKTGKGYVSKPCYDETDKNLTYLGRTPEALIAMLRRWDRECRIKGPFILQEIVSGVEMAVGGWWGPGGFNQGFCENWEEKKLFAGGLGPATGEMGTTIRYVQKSKLAAKMLKPIEELLEKTGHVGYVDVNCIVDDSGVAWPLEFTMRNGYPTFNIQQEIHEGDSVEWLLDLAEGRDARNCVYDRIAVGVVMAQGDFPFTKLSTKDLAGFPIYGLDAVDSGVHLCEVMAGEAPMEVEGKIVDVPCMLTAGDYILIACGTGETVRQARSKAYGVLKELKMPNGPFWRIDIGQRLKKELPLLQAHGFAMGMKY
jgi:phosphoribosylamine--glycine ligase